MGMGNSIDTADFLRNLDQIALQFFPWAVLIEWLCSQQNCQEIEMGVCRFPYKAKPSPEQTFCIDFLKLASQLGWDYYMLGPCVFPEDLPNSYRPYLIGLILIT